MKAKKILIGAVLVAALAGTLVYQLGAKPFRSDGQVRISGNIEVIDAQLGFKISGRVEQRPVDEGDRVKKGQLIARLDTADLECDVNLRAAELQASKAALLALENGSRPEEIAAAEAAAQKASSLLDQLVHGSRPQEIAVARATVASATADKSRAESDLARATQLRVQQGVLSQEDFDRFQSAFKVAVAKLNEANERLALAVEGPRQEEIQQAQAALAQAKAQYQLIKAGPRIEDIEQGRARVRQVEASLELAKTRLSYAELRAPMDGIVLSKNIEPGEYVSPGTPVVTVGDIEHPWLRGYINEMDIDKVKVNQQARVTTSTRSGKAYTGRVSFISQEAEFTPKTVQTEQERVKLVFRVKIDIENPKMELKPGMPADAEIVVE